MKRKYYRVTLGGYPIEPIPCCGFDLDRPYERVHILKFLKKLQEDTQHDNTISGTGYTLSDVKLKLVKCAEMIKYCSNTMPIGTDVVVETDRGKENMVISSELFFNGVDMVISATAKDDSSYTGWFEEFSIYQTK